jgi:hypothetical protein
MGGEALRNGPGETYYAQLKCHDPSGDSKPSASHAPAAHYAPASRDSYVTFTRTTVRLSSYQDDAIRTAVETWADAVGALA